MCMCHTLTSTWDGETGISLFISTEKYVCVMGNIMDMVLDSIMDCPCKTTLVKQLFANICVGYTVT